MKKLVLLMILILAGTDNLVSSPQIIWSTLIGGTFEEACSQIQVDSSENVYITGMTQSTDYPTTPGAYDRKFPKISAAFITKLTPNASDLIFSTLLGCTHLNGGSGIAIEKATNNIYMVGTTQNYKKDSNDYPTTSNAFKKEYFSREHLVVVTKINAKGDSLLYSTFIGIGGGYSIAIDSIGNSYITGKADSNYSSKDVNFPVTPNAYDTVFHGGPIVDSYDGFITKINSTGSALIYSTFLGGNNIEYGNNIELDNNLNAYICGVTASNDFPVTLGSFDTNFSYDSLEGYVTKINSQGSDLIYSTFIGGLNGYPPRLSLDKNGYAIITGATNSHNFPRTSGAFDTTFNSSDNCAIFITKLNDSGTALIYSTFISKIGKNSVIYSFDIALDSSDNAYIVGTCNKSHPLTSDAVFKGMYWPGDYRLFLTELNSKGDKLNYSSFLPYGYGEQNRITLDKKNNIYITGQGGANNLTTKGVFQRIDKSVINSNMIITKFGYIDSSAEIQSINNITFKPILCDIAATDTITIYNTGTSVLVIQDYLFAGIDSSEFSIISPTYLPIYISENDSFKIVVQFKPNARIGKRNDTLYLINNSKNDSLKTIVLIAETYKSFSIDGKDNDIILIDFGTFCNGSQKDTIITVKNLFPVGATLKITNPKSPFKIMEIDKTGKSKEDEPQGVKKKNK